MLTHLRPALVLLVLFTVLTGLVYPLAITGIAQVVFPAQANGSLIEQDGKVVGSALIGQAFTDDSYFQPPPVGDERRRSGRSDQDRARALQRGDFGGSNLGPTSRSWPTALKDDVDELTRKTGVARRSRPTPVTTSGSGLDPHISPATRWFQVPRVAKARGLPGGAACASWSSRRPKAAPSACSASRASTCSSSTSRSTRLGRRLA